MASLRYRLRAEARNRWRAWLGLALLVGLAAGAVISLAAGARRTGDAYQRLVEAEQAPHAFIPDQGWSVLPTAPDFLQKVAALPEVAETSRVSGVADESGITQDGVKMGEPDYVNSFIPLDSAAVDALARQKLIEGRHPDPTAAEEVVVNFTVADRYGLDVGEWFELNVIAGSVYDARFEGRQGPPDPTRRIRFNVVGIVAAANEFPPRSFGDGAGTVIHSQQFATAHADRLPSREALFVRLSAGADLTDFVASVEALADGSDFRLIGASYSQQQDATSEAIRLLSTGLWMLTAFAGLAAAFVIGQAVARFTITETDDAAVLGALGFTAKEVGRLAAWRLLAVELVAVPIAAIVATLASPLFPLGLARIAEPETGVRLDLVTFGAGGAVLVVLLGVVSSLALRRALTSERRSRLADGRTVRPSAIATASARAGLPLTLVHGVRLGLESGRGRTAVPVRTTLVAGAAGVAIVAGAITFVGGLDHLVRNPSLYGWNWDVSVGDGFNTVPNEAEISANLASSREVSGYAAGTLGSFKVNGLSLAGMAVDSERGGVGPSIIEGRPPRSEEEVVLGSSTMADLDLEIGDQVEVGFVGTLDVEAGPEARTREFEVVGEAVLPDQSDEGLDQGIAMTFQGLIRSAGEEPARNLFLVRFVPGVDPEQAIADLADVTGAYTVPTQRPSDLVNFGRVDALPAVAAGLVACVAVAALAHALVTSTRRRRRDMALLKGLGFTGRQITATVVWQATTIAVVSLAVGLPLGVALGRWLWVLVADRLGVVAETVVSRPALLLLIPATLLVAILVALLPARAAARLHPAVVLRAE